MKKTKAGIFILSGICLFFAVIFGTALGLLLSNTVNTINNENFTEFSTALPTRLLDINGELITELSADEKRELIGMDELPQHLLDALLTREDRTFYKHRGFSLKALTRAVVGKLTGKTLGGGSTLTQQIAGTLYCDRTEMTIKRKLKELWWAIQMERRFSKNDILELYLNKIYLGGGTYGVNAASKYYFGHAASEITPAEAAILVVQLSNPGMYNPFEHPTVAQERQKEVLDSMVELNLLSKEQADYSFDEYWLGFDYTRTNSGAYYMREDKAPWFSAYVISELNQLIYGKADIYTGGYTVNTTMNLKHQLAAQDLMANRLEYANNSYQNDISSRRSDAISTYIPIVELLALTFDIPSLKVTQERNELQALKIYNTEINPIIDAMSLLFGIEGLKMEVANRVNAKMRQESGKTTIEGAMIAVENETGHITALVGGSKYDSDNQFIRATQAKLQPGSTFKPLYYSAAIDSREFTSVSLIQDAPYVFYNSDGVQYIPENFKGEWQGQVQLWYALAKSMNIPSLHVLEGIGFDAALNRASTLLGIPQEEWASRSFERVYPIGLGVCSVRPVELARAFAIFGNQGRVVTPFAVRSIEDRTGKTVLDNERNIRLEHQKMGKDAQVISPQTAFVMTEILKKSVTMGTLAYGSKYGTKLTYTDINGKRYTMPSAGKTGTTQNWQNAWAVGYTPYITAVVWFGFDKPGQSLGLALTGSTLSGPLWGDFMYVANEDYQPKDFPVPQTGIVKVKVCSVSGKLLTSACGDHATTQYFLEGTQPTTTCDYHINREYAEKLATSRLEKERFMAGIETPSVVDNSPLKIDLSFLDSNMIPSMEEEAPEEQNETDENTNPFMFDMENENFLLD